MFRKKLEVGIGIGIFIIDPKEQKLLIGKRNEKELFGLPGGWLEKYEEFEEAAQRELFEETGLKLDKSRFKHIITLNCVFIENDYHSLSVVVYTEINDDERDEIFNKEPSKCRGWFWTTIEECRKYENRLFYPIRTLLNELPDLKDIQYLKKMSERGNN
jgi:ADP-ribose pyrophosphatase YjhB (NUDIX family)